jgi:hypothetical protein
MRQLVVVLLLSLASFTAPSLGQDIEVAMPMNLTFTMGGDDGGQPITFMAVPGMMSPEPDNLVSTPRVANDLQLVDSQRQDLKNELARIKDKYQPRIEAAMKRLQPEASADEQSGAQKELQKIGEEKNKEIRESIDRILFPFQRQRLVQIAAQARLNNNGAGALHSEEFAKELKLTEEQKKELAKAQKALGKKLQEEYRRLRIKLQREAVESVLTKSQREKLAEMLGDDLAEEKPTDKNGDNPKSSRK